MTPTPSHSASDGQALVRIVPLLFVMLWSTGFIGAKFGLPHAEPLTFLLIRFLLVCAILLAVALLTGAPWPETPRQVLHIAVAGLLIHATYLGGVFVAIDRGLPAGTAALITGLQPLLTAVVAAPYLGEHVSGRQWLGLLLGFAGVFMVVADKASLAEANLGNVLPAFVAVLGITLGTLYQKRHGGGMDVRSGSVIQFAASAVVMALLAPLLETMDVNWTGEFLFALGWLTVVLSLGAISLLILMIRHGAASRVASFFYLVPATTALFAYLMFGETLGPLSLSGMVVTSLGVALANR
ncbi:MAG: DMT family transporter [Gammaproteobacteria bacterium]|nr:DMT family transporter [Gammaproteobacteria bacterium]